MRAYVTYSLTVRVELSVIIIIIIIIITTIIYNHC